MLSWSVALDFVSEVSIAGGFERVWVDGVVSLSAACAPTFDTTGTGTTSAGSPMMHQRGRPTQTIR